MVYVWIVIAVVAVAVLVALLLLTRRRKQEQRVAHAGHLRAEAQSRTGDIVGARQEVEVASEEAEVKRAEAERAEEQVRAAERDLAHAEASQEDVLREADHLDPHRRADALDTPPAPTGSHRKEV